MDSHAIRASVWCIALTGITLLPACISLHAPAVRPLPASLARYHVRFGHSGDTAVAEVRARIPVSKGVLLMYPEGAETFVSGWAHFVTRLEAKDTMGRAVELKPEGAAQWRVSGVDVVDLSYRVQFLHDRDPSKWQFGVKEVAYVRPDLVFTTGKALFITNFEMPPAVVQIDAPARQRAFTSWSRVPDASDVFRVSGPQELTESMIVVGSPMLRDVRVGDTRVNVVVSPQLRESGAAVAARVEQFLPAAVAVFGSTPPDTLLVVAERDTSYVGGGAAFHGGISLMFPDKLGPNNRARWGHVLDHEIMHLWIGYRLRSADEAPEYWFSEGFTDYATWMLEAAHGLVAEDTLQHVIRERSNHYERQAGQASMHSVSAEKAKYYDLIYSGGFLVALALDIEIRGRTDLKRGLPDVLRALYAEFGLAKDVRYTAADVVRAVTDTCACDLRPFFTAYVFGRDVLQTEDVVARLGFVAPEADTTSHMRTGTASSGAPQLYTAWLAGWRTRAVRP